MRRLLRSLPSPAMVVALIALFVAMGGVSYGLAGSNIVTSGDIVNGAVKTKDIKNNDVRSGDIRNSTVRGRDVRNNTLTGSDVDESALGTVPSALAANTANNAGALDGKDSSEFAPAARENIRFVGTAGNPPFLGNWSSPGFPGDEEAGFLKDPYGIVHLYGNAERSTGTDDDIFQLPAGYRPPESLFFSVYGAGGTPAFVRVESDGTVGVFGPDNTFIGLGSVSFPVAP
jgi:hypothetical protein